MTAKLLAPYLASALIMSALVVDSAGAAHCGDPLKLDHVSLSNGVVILRSAVGLSSACTPAICDVDLDGNVGVTDGVLTLRVAAGISTAHVTCGEEEVDRQGNRVFFAIQKSPTAHAGARVAGTTTIQCANGGYIEDRGGEFENFLCNNGQTITNGLVTFDQQDTEITDATFHGFTVEYLDASHEQSTLDGRLSFQLRPGSTTDFDVDGFITTSSTVRGDFTDRIIKALLIDSDAGGGFVSGTFRTEVARGIGPYAHLTTLQTELSSNGLRVVHLELAGGATSAFTLGGRSLLCGDCTAGTACGAGLACRACVSDCTGSTQRCAVSEPITPCGDGIFGDPQ